MRHGISQSQVLDPVSYRQIVGEKLAPLLPVDPETLPIARALGRVIASDVLAVENSPAFANSQMDGYALTAAAAGRENRVFTVGRDVPAGTDPSGLPVNDDTVYPLMTGAALPAGYCCVVPEEVAEPLGKTEGSFAATGSRVRLPATALGTYVRGVGEDIVAGEKILAAATVLTPARLGVLASQGIDRLEVLRQPKVLILTGGDEVVETGQPGTGHIRDANGPMLEALLAEDGAHTARLTMRDDPRLLVDELQKTVVDFRPQIIVSSGGISHGKYEVVKQAVERVRAGLATSWAVEESWFGHVAQQPGGPQGLVSLTYNTDQGRHRVGWLAFPGNPVSTLISYRLLLGPVLARYRGQDSAALYGVLAGENEIHGLAEKTQFRRAQAEIVYRDDGGAEIALYPDCRTGSHLLQRASSANALVEVEANTSYAPGDVLRWYRL